MSERLYGATLLRRTAGVAMDRLQRPVRELHDGAPLPVRAQVSADSHSTSLTRWPLNDPDPEPAGQELEMLLFPVNWMSLATS